MAGMDVTMMLGQPVAEQLVEKTRLSRSEKDELAKKLESSCWGFDRSGKGKLTVDELYNVVKIQAKIDVTKEELRRLVADLPMDRNYKLSINDFLKTPVLSIEVFKAMDKNGDGVISKGELKLAKKHLSMKQIEDIIKQLDKDDDGKLDLNEVKGEQA